MDHTARDSRQLLDGWTSCVRDGPAHAGMGRRWCHAYC